MFEFQQVQTHDLSKDTAPNQRSNDKAPAAHGVDLPTEILSQLTRSETPLVDQLARLQTEDPEMFREVLRSLALTQGNAFVNRVIERLNPAQAQAAPNSERTRLARRSFHAASSQDTRGLFDSIFGPAEETQQKPSISQVIKETPSKSLPMREQLEQRFGEDLGHIQVHTGPQVSAFLKEHGAQGAAIGQHILLKDNAAPHTIAEEVAHSKQQGPITAEDLAKLDHSAISQPGDISEREASGVADQFVAGQPLDAVRERRAPHLARQLEGEQTESSLKAAAIEGPAEKVIEWVQSLSGDSTFDHLHVDEAFKMIGHLLQGGTCTDAELSGLVILNYLAKKSLFNSILEILIDNLMFEQLLDDYHGDEYLSLIGLIDEQTSALSSKTKQHILLHLLDDACLNEAENKLILDVILDQHQKSEYFYESNESPMYLQNRDGAIKFAASYSIIANDEIADLLREFLQDHNEHKKTFESALSFYFAQKSVKIIEDIANLHLIQIEEFLTTNLCTNDEAMKFFKLSMEDIVYELSEMNFEIFIRLSEGEKIDDAMISLENRLNEIRISKIKEFEMEIKYKKEIKVYQSDYDLQDVSGWSLKNLEELEQILEKIPASLLEKVSKIQSQSEGGGHEVNGIITINPLEGKVKIFCHEAGHRFASTNGSVYKKFITISKWQDVTEKYLKENGVTDQEIGKIKKASAKNRTKVKISIQSSEFWAISDYTLETEFYIVPVNAKFVRSEIDTEGNEYASYHPQEDFAESFSMFMIDSDLLNKQVPQKYDFLKKSLPAQYENSCK